MKFLHPHTSHVSSIITQDSNRANLTLKKVEKKKFPQNVTKGASINLSKNNFFYPPPTFCGSSIKKKLSCIPFTHTDITPFYLLPPSSPKLIDKKKEILERNFRVWTTFDPHHFGTTFKNHFLYFFFSLFFRIDNGQQ